MTAPATHDLAREKSDFVLVSGLLGSRSVARNEYPEKLKNKVERAKGRDIGLDPRFTYFRYKPQTTGANLSTPQRRGNRVVRCFTD